MAGTSYLYRVVSCCDTRIFGEFQSPVNIPTGTYTYSGPTYIDPDNGFEWVNGQCYQIIKVGTGGAPTGAILPDTDLTRIIGDCLTEPCPCASDNRYLIFQKCCDNSLIYFKSTEDGSYLVGFKEYTGAPTYLLENICYRVDTVAVGIGPIVDNTMWNALPLAPNAPNYTGPTNVTIDCTDEGYQAECPVCVEKCFMLTTCDGNIIYTNTNLSLYVGQFITINDQDNNPIVGTWYVIEKDLPCPPNSFFSSLQVTGSNLQPDCPNECYEVTGTPTIVIYVDQDKVTQELLGPGKFCSIVQPIIMGGTGEVFNYGLCVNNECPEVCYLFTNCITSETLTVVSNTPNISQYASQNKVVTLNGYDGCWTIELSEVCECPVNVTILQVFDDCPSCLPTIAYKFTNCNNQAIVRYSTDDYSAYVGKTVELDCGECWFVDQIDYVPPATQPIVILYTFDSCLACNRTYYKLTDCLDPNVNITYTYSDLSAYVNQIVKIKGCDSCFTVTETREPINAGIVEVTDSYIDCPECLSTFPCICSTITNDQLTEQTYCYLDCEFNQQSIILQPGETSDKLCVIKWIVCPTNDCNCILGTAQSLEVIPSPVEQSILINFNFLPTGEIYNGKPVYQDCFATVPQCNPPQVCYTLKYESNGCWIASATNTDCEFRGSVPVFSYCSTDDCPKFSDRDWTYIPCTCVYLTLGDLESNFSVTLYATNYNQQYLTYTNGAGGIYIIRFNEDLERWELWQDNGVGEILIAYNAFGSVCSPITDWIIVSSLYTSVQTESCNKDNLNYSFTTTTCPTDCNCLEFTFVSGSTTYNFVWLTTGEIRNGYAVYSGALDGETYEVYYEGFQWVFQAQNSVFIFATQATANICPIGNWMLQVETTINQMTSALCESTKSLKTVNITNTDILGYITNYGDCINNQCPVIKLPIKKVKPGYSTPSCDIEKYEKITCKSSEIYYKQVLRLRYGISNCCPEDEEKWLIKKELIDLDAARDPDYICQPVTTCCNQPIDTCGCGCNQTIKTCNSQ